MEAGKLRERVTIQRPTMPPGPYGQDAAPTWADVRTVWAAVRQLRAAEIVRAQQAGSETTLLVNIRYADDVTADCRLVWRGRTLDVVGVIEVNARRTELEIMCTERKAQ